MLLDNWLAFPASHAFHPSAPFIRPEPRPGARLRTVLRYRLVLVAGGAFEWLAPDPIVIRAATTLTPLVARAHTTTTTRLAIDDDAAIAYRSNHQWTVGRIDILTIADPDEWIILDDPTLS